MDGYSIIFEKFGIPITEQMELDILTWNRLLRDAAVLRLKETEEGRDYLKDCHRFTLEDPDYSALERLRNHQR